MARAVPHSHGHHARIMPGYHRVGLVFLAATAVLSVVQVVRRRRSFAGDAELPALARRVRDERIDDPRLIKRSIRDWQVDFPRV